MTIKFETSRMNRLLLVLCGTAGLPLAGCGVSSTVQRQFSLDYDCSADDVTVESTFRDHYTASGCGEYATYRCTNGQCAPVTSSEAEDDSDAAGRSPARAAGAEEVATTAEKPSPKKSAVVADIVLDKGFALRLSAVAGEQAGPVSLWLRHVESGTVPEECELGLMLNGQKVETGPTKRARQGAISALGVAVPGMLLSELGAASQMALRACDKRINLSVDQLIQVREFAINYQTELAWNGEAKSGKTGGLLAPASGWPAWTISSARPPAKTSGADLRGEQLFKLLAPSVVQVRAAAGGATSQGSAVAVGPTEVLTNCHVVSGAQKIVATSGKKEWQAKLLRADPSTDRCVLSLSGARLTPVRGVRTYEDLKVGEPLYTLGSPNGLELSLANGILSGLREEEGHRLVQTTAPISPGSSGGGLFDSRGNLVGITTLVLVGRERLNQSLNFAIPADSFWQPNS